MIKTVLIAPFDGGALFDADGNRVGSYCKETGRGMFAHAFFADEMTCHVVPMDAAGEPPYRQSERILSIQSEGCSECGGPWNYGVPRYCPHCGSRVVRGDAE